MNTFLPYADYEKSADVLDKRRKGKQRVEVLQILAVLVDGKKAWSNHPFVKMWKGYEIALCYYGLAVCRSWIRTGCEDKCKPKIQKYLLRFPTCDWCEPPFIDNEKFHSSHRAALLYKGWLDLTCTVIPKPIDAWLKNEMDMVKSDFKTVQELKALQDILEFWPAFGDSYYALRTNWKEKPIIDYYLPEF